MLGITPTLVQDFTRELAELQEVCRAHIFRLPKSLCMAPLPRGMSLIHFLLIALLKKKFYASFFASYKQL